MQTVTIMTLNGPRETRASRFGSLAVHRTVTSVPDHNSGWNVTAPCGLRIGPIVPLRKLAVALCHDLLAIEGVDWQVTRPDDWPEETVNTIKAICAKYKGAERGNDGR